MGWPTLTTDRLVLRPLAMDDLDDLVALHAAESFWRYPWSRLVEKRDRVVPGTHDSALRGPWRCGIGGRGWRHPRNRRPGGVFYPHPSPPEPPRPGGGG